MGLIRFSLLRKPFISQSSKQGSQPSKELTTKVSNGAKMVCDELASRLIDSAIELHHDFDPRVLGAACPRGSGHEPSVATKADFNAFQLQLSLPVQNKDVELDCGYQNESFVENPLLIA